MNEVGIADIPDKIKKTTTVDREGKFEFTRVQREKKYNMVIEKKHFCWVKDSIKLHVKKESRGDMTVFEHVGYRITYDADFAFKLQTTKNGKTSNVDVTEGEGQFCLQEAGQWKLKPVSECAVFMEEEAVIETDEENHLNFRAERVKVSGSIVHHKEEKIHISELRVQVAGEEALLKRKSEDRVQYSIYLPSDVNTRKLVIKAYSNDKLLMFTPTKADTEAPTAPCIVGTDFSVSRGLMLEGQVTPAVENVTVTVKVGEEIIETTLTGADGRYVFGPLPIGQEYKVWARKDDYIIEA